MTLRAVLFDLDGVLVDSLAAWHRLLLDALERFGGAVATVSEPEFRERFGQSVEADCDRWLPGVAPARLEAFYVERFPHRAGLVRAMPGAAELLQRLGRRGRGVPLGCATNAVSAAAREMLRRTGLADGLDAVVGADEVARPKPAPDLVIECARRLGIAPGETALCGDSRFDIEAARAAGAFAVGLGCPGGDLTIAALGELEDALGARLQPAAGLPPG